MLPKQSLLQLFHRKEKYSFRTQAMGYSKMSHLEYVLLLCWQSWLKAQVNQERFLFLVCEKMIFFLMHPRWDELAGRIYLPQYEKYLPMYMWWPALPEKIWDYNVGKHILVIRLIGTVKHFVQALPLIHRPTWLLRLVLWQWSVLFPASALNAMLIKWGSSLGMGEMTALT